MLGLSPRWYVPVAQAAESMGAESVWTQDHVVFPAAMPATYPYTENGDPGFAPTTPLFDVWVALSTIAATTSTLRLATNVYILPLRSPFITARSATTLDRVSGGRLLLGVGVGWLREEYEALQVPWADRGGRMDECIDVVRALWTEPEITHAGAHFHFDAVCFEPKPLQKPTVPLHIGGESAPAMRRAAERGDGWILTYLDAPADVATKTATMRDQRARAGREELAFEVTGSIQRDASADLVGVYGDAGVDRVIVDAMGARSADEAIDIVHTVMQRFGVAPP